MPTLRKWTGYNQISEVSGPGSEGTCRQAREVRAEKPHPKSGGGNTKGRFRCGAETVCTCPCRRTQRRETGSQTHSTGEIGRLMPVIGERERGELPHPTSFSRAERPGERSKISIRVFEQETRGRETVGGPFCVPGSRSGGFSKDVAELVRVRAGYAQSEREKPEFSQIRLHPYQARQEIPAPCPMHLNAAR